MAKKGKDSVWPDLMTPGFSAFNPLAAAPSGANESLMPGANMFGAGIDFMKNFWGALPSGGSSMAMPSVNLDELDQRIKDLRAVEAWLELNANMLRATIQGLDVQRNTLVAFNAMTTAQGEMLEQMSSKAPARATKHAAAAAPSAPAAQHAADAAPAAAKAAQAVPPLASTWMNFLQEQFARVASASLAPNPLAARNSASAATTPSTPAAKKRVAKKSARRRRKAAKPRVHGD